jgi:hypothetical protein
VQTISILAHACDQRLQRQRRQLPHRAHSPGRQNLCLRRIQRQYRERQRSQRFRLSARCQNRDAFVACGGQHRRLRLARNRNASLVSQRLNFVPQGFGYLPCASQ